MSANSNNELPTTKEANEPVSPTKTKVKILIFIII
jgi:hypothetical protein